jgi:hypothetical protein
LAQEAGADLVLDSTNQNTSSVSMVFRMAGVPNWTETVIAMVNSGSQKARGNDDAPGKRTASTEHLRFGVFDFKKVIDHVPAGDALKRKDAEINERLKELGAKGDDSSASKADIHREGVAFMASIASTVDHAMEPDYNIVFESGGKSENGAPLMVSDHDIPDLTEELINKLRNEKQ